MPIHETNRDFLEVFLIKKDHQKDEKTVRGLNHDRVQQ